MALKVKAVERLLKFDKESAGKYRYVMKPEMYSSLSQAKVIREAALRSGVSQGVMKACWDAAGEVIKAWATEGHSVALPGLGSMRFGLRSKAVEKVEDVKTSLISSRRIIFTPSVDLKDELANTAIQITCYDRNGNEVKRVTSTSGEVEDPENENTQNTENGGSQNQGGSENQGSQSGNEGGNSQNQATSFALSITKSGSGTSTVKNDSEETINSGDSLESGANVYIAVTPAEGQIPSATLNGSNVSLTENDGEYVGTFQMPAQASTLVINSGSDAEEGDQN
jgi:predicted histone-like DNA-binding protein